MRGLLILLVISFIPLSGNASVKGDVATENEDFENFKISEIDEKISSYLKQHLDNNKIEIDHASVARDGGKRYFSIEKVKELSLENEYSIANLDVNEGNSSFILDVIDNTSENKLIVRGNYSEKISVPVLRQKANRGDILSHKDFDYIDIDKNRILKNTVINAEEMVGKEAMRNIRAGRQISINHIDEPVLIQKDSLITAIFRIKNLEVKTVARALADGSEGELIVLENHDSGKVFQGYVKNSGVVIVKGSSMDGQNIASSTNQNNKNIN